MRWIWVSGFHNVESGVNGVHDGSFRSGDPTLVAGTTFEVTFENDFLEHGDRVRLFRAEIEVHDLPGMTVLDTRNVYIVVPARDGTIRLLEKGAGRDLPHHATEPVTMILTIVLSSGSSCVAF